MFSRLHGYREGDDSPDQFLTTYAEDLLDRAAAGVADQISAGTLTDPIAVIGAEIVRLEVEGGYPPAPEADLARDQFVRTYATLLLDNDRQPPHAQMSAEDLRKPRALLGSFFTGARTMQADAQTVLRFIEERFSRGRFGQARLLLQLFDTDAATRRNNERNLFYEEMILRFLAERRDNPKAPEIVAPRDATRLQELAARLARDHQVRLHAFRRDPARGPQWRDVLSAATPAARASVELVVPGQRWRGLWLPGDELAAITEQFAQRGVRDFVSNLTHSIYFVTLAPGATGFEFLVARYLAWISDNFDAVATRILPRLHRSSTLDEISIGEAFDSIWIEQLMSAPVVRRQFEPEECEQGIAALCDKIDAGDLGNLPDGDYDFGGMLMAQLLGFETDDVKILARLNRIT